jgi:hypothetical protein
MWILSSPKERVGRERSRTQKCIVRHVLQMWSNEEAQKGFERFRENRKAYLGSGQCKEILGSGHLMS